MRLSTKEVKLSVLLWNIVPSYPVTPAVALHFGGLLQFAEENKTGMHTQRESPAWWPKVWTVFVIVALRRIVGK